MKKEQKMKKEQEMLELFQVEELEKRYEMAWLSGKVVNGDTGYVYIKGS